MNKLKKIFTIILLFSFLFLLFRYNYILNTSVIEAFTLFITKVFPTLFIMFILNDVIINSNILNNLNNYLNPLFNKIFTTSGNSSLAFILSLFSGTPSSAFILKEMVNNKSITVSDANKLIAFTYFSNPLFLFTILKLTFNTYITIKIILFSYLTNIVIGILFRDKNNNYNILNKSISQNKHIIALLPSSINKSFNTLLMILGTITFYIIITNYLIYFIPFNNFFKVLIKGLLEITQGLNILNILNNSSIIKEIIALIIISFGGFSIHTQIYSLISDTKIKYINFLRGRIYHILISTTTYLFFSYFCIS